LNLLYKVHLRISALDNGHLQVVYKKKRAPSSILHEAKIAYYARNMFEAARLVFS